MHERERNCGIQRYMFTQGTTVHALLSRVIEIHVQLCLYISMATFIVAEKRVYMYM